MRTTLQLDDDVVEAARSLAHAEGVPLGRVVSELVRRGLAPRPAVVDLGSGFPTFRVSPNAPPITLALVDTALDEM